MFRVQKIALVSATVVLLSAASALTALAATLDLPDGAKLDLAGVCPVCNMKVDSSIMGPAALVLKDGKVIGFDGPGDLFRYVLATDKPAFKADDVKAVFLTEYGTKNFIDAKTAFFVIGSEVSGAMGPEVIPFSKKEDAERFKSEHHGKGVVAFGEVKADDVQSRKKMMKMKH